MANVNNPAANTVLFTNRSLAGLTAVNDSLRVLLRAFEKRP
jgi:hypothetical protein